MARITRASFLAIAVVFHLIYAFSIFDIYFVSPIVSGMRPHRVENQNAPAKRLVLFVGDGLRADKAFQSFPDPSIEATNDTSALIPKPLAPFIRSRVLEHGTFGVSHTRVPTESRPGHVAMIAGLYEDVSAVTTGWKLNPVNFDSVFNRSRHTWSWGSPDICPMFKEGATPGRVDADTYPPHFEDFSKDGMICDIWVFDKVRAMFEKAKADKELDARLRMDKNVFFLHLLGLDSTGHTHRPYSKSYLQNIQLVDRGVQEMTQIVNDFFEDDETAFIFTADHGMSDWGSHGDGHPDNTRTPLVAWGSGIAKPVISSKGKAPGHEDGFSYDWNLDKVQRNDVSQADIAALMAYLVGVEFPVNSVGELPLPFLSAEPLAKADALLANTRGILEMYRVKEEEKKASALAFKPYSLLSGMDGHATTAEHFAHIEKLIADGNAEAAIEQCVALTKMGLDGLRYLQTYNWLFLRALVTIGYLGWMTFAITTVLDLHVLHGETAASRTVGSYIVFSSGFVLLCSFLFIQKSSWTYYAYAIFPMIFWEEVFARREALIKGCRVLFGTRVSLGAVIIKALGFLGLLEALVQSYVHREVYTVVYILAVLWPFYYGTAFVKQNLVLSLTWAFACASMALFTLLPAMKTESLPQILLGGALMLIVGVLYLLNERSLTASKKSTARAVLDNSLSRGIIGAQVGLVALAMLVTRSSVAALSAKNPHLPIGTQVVGWIVLISSLAVPFLHGLQPNGHYLHRLAVMFLSFSPSFIILTISYEGLFYFAFCLTLVTWVRLEYRTYAFTKSTSAMTTPEASTPASNGSANHKTSGTNGRVKISTATTNDTLDKVSQALKPTLASLQSRTFRSITLSDARISLFLLFFIQSGFFSTGNIASVSSFSLDAVKRLIPVFDPFSQGALLLFKILAPFVLVSANLGVLNRRLGVAPSALFMILTAMSDVLTLNFFWMVRDEGSWLEIGETISRFVIASGLCVFVAGLEGLSGVLVGGVEFEDDDSYDNYTVADKDEYANLKANGTKVKGINGSSVKARNGSRRR